MVSFSGATYHAKSVPLSSRSQVHQFQHPCNLHDLYNHEASDRDPRVAEVNKSGTVLTFLCYGLDGAQMVTVD